MPRKLKAMPQSRVLSLPEVIEKVGIGKSSIYRKAAAGAFPAPIAIGERATGWLEHELDEWLANRPRRGRRAA